MQTDSTPTTRRKVKPNLADQLSSSARRVSLREKSQKKRLNAVADLIIDLQKQLHKLEGQKDPQLGKRIESLKKRVTTYERQFDDIIKAGIYGFGDDKEINELLSQSIDALEEEETEELIEVNGLNSNSQENLEIIENTEMALTVQDWRDFADANTQAIVESMAVLNAVTFKREIPEYLGELEGGMTIEEWIKKAYRVGNSAGWTNDQKFKFFQERLAKSAANLNETLAADKKDTLEHWIAAMKEAFHDNAAKALRKTQLKQIKQQESERVRDLKKRIDDTYRLAYGDAVADSRDAQVTILREEIKKEVLLNGIKPNIANMIWGRLAPNADYAASVITAMECKQILEMRRVAEQSESPVERSAKQTSTADELKQIVQQLANLKMKAQQS